MFAAKARYFVIIILAALLLLGSSSAAQPPDPQINPALVDAVFNAMTPAERVGQLFLVSFNGNQLDATSDIAQLVQVYRVGGVAISARNRNFFNGGDTPAQVVRLTNSLQTLAQQPPAPETLQKSAELTVTAVLTSSTYNPIPLFIAVEHEGDGFPNTQIRGGKLPDVPSAMALGATWNLDNARAVGEAVGHDLPLLGVNMLFGPSLDVQDNPRSNQPRGLGVRTFGGSPYWVGEMGHAYIEGIHQGSGGRLLTIAKHFPGFGSSDREINREVPTILKSLDDLRRVELPPFFKVTNLSNASAEGVTDGVMTAHARYQGLSGNVPISLDARNLPALLALKELGPWKDAGGLVISASLGAPAAVDSMATSRDMFPARRLVQDAFLAGSDILQLVNFSFDPENSTAQLRNIADAITFFQERYTTDANFQTVVDQRVKNIIRAKMKIFGPDLFNAAPQINPDAINQLGTVPLDLNRIAQAGVTLITPATRDGRTVLANPPQTGENILIFVDDRLGQDCAGCARVPLINPTAIEDQILQLFGPAATGQILPEQISSLGYSALKEILAPPPEPDSETQARIDATETLLADADWVIFAMLNIEPDSAPQSDAMRVLLRTRNDSLRNKRLVLFAFNAPYFLDETEISQLTAFYSMYSKSSYYIEAAARVLFQQFEPAGASPVAIPAIGPLNLSPDPNQVIDLIPIQVTGVNGTVSVIEQVPESGSIDLKVGDSILFRTGVIVDKNGHPVPDGVVVDFFRYYPLEGLSLEPLQGRTKNGIAEVSIVKERDTPLQVRASSNLAVQSVTFNVGPGIVDTPTPTPSPTISPTATWTPTPPATDTPTPEDTSTPTPEPTATPMFAAQSDLNGGSPVDLLDLVYALAGAVVIAGIAFTLGGDRFPLEERVRSALVPVASGLVGYIFYTMAARAFPNSEFMHSLVRQSGAGHWAAPLVSVVFAVLGVIIWHLKPGRVFWRKA